MILRNKSLKPVSLKQIQSKYFHCHSRAPFGDKIIFKYVSEGFCRGFCIVSPSGCLQWLEGVPSYILSPLYFSHFNIHQHDPRARAVGKHSISQGF